MTRQMPFEPLPASVLFGLVWLWELLDWLFMTVLLPARIEYRASSSKSSFCRDEWECRLPKSQPCEADRHPPGQISGEHVW